MLKRPFRPTGYFHEMRGMSLSMHLAKSVKLASMHDKGSHNANSRHGRIICLEAFDVARRSLRIRGYWREHA